MHYLLYGQMRFPKVDIHEIDRSRWVPVVATIPNDHDDKDIDIFPIKGKKLLAEFDPGLVDGVVT